MQQEIRVVARFRPFNQKEKESGSSDITQIQDNVVSIQSQDYTGSFTFDHVFQAGTTQTAVFESVGLPLIDQCFEGFNSTLFCYGQTSSGKTYTMMGQVDDQEQRGVIPRLVEAVFTKIDEAPSQLEFTVQTSFLEIYLEKVRDLLCPENDNLPVHEDKVKGVYIKGLQEVYVSNLPEVFEVLKTGEQSRKVASTNMNEVSSRSHSIFIMSIMSKDTEKGTVKQGRLYLVDLAGSEKVGKTGATGQTLEEAKKINKSLSALGNVINNLTDGKSQHIPYRDSKLTRILQESLGGNSKTTLIINCSPSSFNDSETVSTLRFGMRAKTIKNQAVVNVEKSASELKAALKKANSSLQSAQSYITSMEQELAVWRNGGVVEPAEYARRLSANSLAAEGTSTPTRASLPSVSILDSSPAQSVDYKDELDDLTEQLSKKDKDLDRHRTLIANLSDQLQENQTQSNTIQAENQELQKRLTAMKVENEKTLLESKDMQILLDELRDQLAAQQERVELQPESEEMTTLKRQLEVLLAQDSKQSVADQLLKLEAQYVQKEKLLYEQLQGLPENFEQEKLMRDLQDRCQRVVELQIELDRVQDDYNSLLKNSDLRENEKKMQFLERNLDQLSEIQKQLIDQNTTLQRQLQAAERKVSNRNDNISHLENMLDEFNGQLAHNQLAHEKEVDKLQGVISTLTRHNDDLKAKFSFNGRVKKPIKGKR